MESNLSGGGSTFVKVMTDEQVEILREQIAVYASICEQLVEMHKSLTAHNDLAGARLGNLYCDPFITSNNSHKITSRQRWSPSAKQLQILERIFNQGINNPGKVKVPEITAELLQHGHVTETNVYNWFQNRRARSKRKQPASATVNGNAESELENEDEQSMNDNKKAEVTHLHHQATNVPCPTTEDVVGSQSTDVDRCNSSKPENHELLFQESGNNDTFEDIQFYGINHVIGNYNSYLQQDDCNITR